MKTDCAYMYNLWVRRNVAFLKTVCLDLWDSPKRAAAAALNFVLSSSSEPKDESMASFRSEEGPFELEGFVMTFQKNVWL